MNPQRHFVVRGCTGCDTCRSLCPAEAITYDLEGAHIHQEKCIGCGTCMENCASEAIREISEEEYQKLLAQAK
ncbi:MAG: 4Fe-4S binding protein [Victivallales bacterium]|nr:4Fe-4S binding protein [Victivallales bacterium]